MPLRAIGTLVAATWWCGTVAAQQPAGTPPEPKLPPMPSMEGQQGDVSKPVTQIPPRKKPAPVEKKSAKEPRPAAVHKKR